MVQNEYGGLAEKGRRVQYSSNVQYSTVEYSNRFRELYARLVVKARFWGIMLDRDNDNFLGSRLEPLYRQLKLFSPAFAFAAQQLLRHIVTKGRRALTAHLPENVEAAGLFRRGASKACQERARDRPPW